MLLDKIARVLTRKPKMVLFVACIVLILSLVGYAATRINYDILTYLPQDLEASQGMNLLEEPFQMAATSMLIIEDMPAGYSNELVNEIKNIDGVSNAVWISNLVGVQVPVSMIPANLRDMFFSGQSTMMIIQYSHAGASESTMDAIAEIRSLCNEKCFLAGFSVLIKDTRDLVNKELPLFIGLALALALIAMELTLESTLLPLILIANIGIAVVYNFGSNIFMGEISYITKAIAAVLQLGVTMDYSVFLFHRYEEEREKYEDHREAMAVAVKAAFTTLSGSSLTTVAGFLALCFMRMTLGRDIGIVMAKGVILGVATVIVVLPSLILLADKALNKHRHKTVLPDFDKMNEFIIEHRRIFVCIALVAILPAIYAQQHAEMYYKLDESLPKDLPSVIGNEKLKEEFNMATSHFAILSDDVSANNMKNMERELHEVAGITDVISYNSLIGIGIPDFFIPEDIRNMLKRDGYQLMMINSAYATASDEVAAQIDEVISIIKTYDPNALVTGEAVMTNDLIKTTDVDFKVTNYLSILAVFLIVAILFRSISVPIVLVAAIELAIFMNQGIPYFTGSQTAFVAPIMIGCVQLGATVDYAILMTTRFREELRAGKDRKESIIIAASASDPAIITSALVLFCATIGVSLIAAIDMIGAICVMIARGALISSIICIFLLPALLYVCEPFFNKLSIGWRKDKNRV